MARSNVPKFGNWESEDSVPYTVYFDKARKTRGEKIINPNDPLENPDMFRKIEPSPLAPAAPAPLKTRTKPEEPIVRGSVKQIHDHRVSRDDADFRQLSNSTVRNENVRQRPPSESSYGGRVNRANQSTRSSAGSEYSIESSPHHPQARNAGRGVGSAPWEGTNYENNHGIRARSRLGPIAQEDNSPEKGAAVPRFGDWNEHDPRSAENLTLVFDKVRQERNPTPGHVSNAPKRPSYSPQIQRPSNEPKKCCFPWW
ncbi:RPM1-interacting protein 4-like [Henckelia pumila]|uniref:RPM1-interacting protein 4-like n=1 Tax=Henckelia pumila TaxID=405737 RepID=UPI003C6DCE0D